ncbi:MAG TPA: DUF1592 domain-containing protein [Verrucomicrobiae bacterium]
MSSLTKKLLLCCGVTGLLLAVTPVQGAASLDFKKAAVPFMEKYCYDCHGGKSTKADLDLKAIKDDKKILEDHKLWRGVLQQVNSGEMPPKKAAHKPTPEEIEKFNNSLTESFHKAESKLKPDPGHVTMRRLNRLEYNNTVRDLTAVDYFPAENFPADDIGHGFDNIGDVLTISPVHLERYLDAADGIAQRAIFLTLPKPNSRTTSSNFLRPRYGSENSTRPMTNSEPDVYYDERIDKVGEYIFRVRVRGTNAPGTEPAQFALLLDDKELGKFTWDAEEAKQGEGQRRSRSGWKEFEVPLSMVSTGEHRFKLRYLNQQLGEVTNRMLYVNAFQVIGPADTRTEFMKKADAVAAGKPPEQRVHPLVEWFVTRAFRRPATKEEVARYVRVFEAGKAANTNSFEAGFQQMVKTVLCSPKFLFRTELDDRPKVKDAHALGEYQLASRLSYFLWCSMPDEELLALAGKNQLTANLDAQVKRMLKDPRAESLVKNFGLQWLQLQRLMAFTPDATLFQGVDDRLKRSMLRETEMFLGEIIREDRSVLELIDADFTYLNRPLARHYGIEDKVFPRGQRDWRRDNDFIRVTLPDNTRGGLLTQASILTVTSNPTRTSPVKRGKWVLEQILGTPPPPPPPGVSELDEQHELKGSLRQRMEQHRANPACANCHQQMDAMGFAFENFDAVGRFRSKDGNDVIDPSGVLPDGQSFKGAGELKGILKGKKDLLARNVTEKLMIYALGRGLEYYDERTIKQVVANMAQNDYKFSTLVTSIVQSDPFRLRRGKELKEKNDLGE